MAEVLKHGSEWYANNKFAVCDKCQCEFIYNLREIKQNHKRVDSEYKPVGKPYILCPECGYKIKIENQ